MTDTVAQNTNPPQEDASKPTRKIERRLYPKDWWEIVSMAKNGVPVHKIAKTFKVQRSTIYRGLKQRRVTIGNYAPTAAEGKAKEERDELVRRVQETKQRDYTYTDFLQRQIITIVTDAQKAGTPIGNRIEDIKALKIALDGIKNGTANKWLILGLDKDNKDADAVLPELPVRELTPVEMIAIRDKQALEDLDDDALSKLDDEPMPDDGEGDEEIVEEGESEQAPAGS